MFSWFVVGFSSCFVFFLGFRPPRACKTVFFAQVEPAKLYFQSLVRNLVKNLAKNLAKNLVKTLAKNLGVVGGIFSSTTGTSS